MDDDQARLHDAIDVIGEVFKRYSTLFTAGGYVSLVAVIQHHWKAIFREPWIKPKALRRPRPDGR